VGASYGGHRMKLKRGVNATGRAGGRTPPPVKLPTEPWEGQGAAKSGFSGEGQGEGQDGRSERLKMACGRKPIDPL
jgi:hypothetical protein